MGLSKVFFWGMMISFMGTLPVGTLNIAAMQISVQEGIRNAMYFSVGTILVELMYVRLALVGISWIRKQKNLLRWMEWLTFVIVLLLAVGSFIAATKIQPAGNVMLDNHLNRFVLGMFLSAITPMHIPFWLGWSTVLYTKKILQPIRSHYNLYILATGIGTFIANCIFIFGGKYVVQKLNTNQHTLNWIIGGIFLITAIIQLARILFHKGAAEVIESR